MIPAADELFSRLIPPDGAVLAVSGGPDSTALLHLAAEWRPQGTSLWVASVDHGLRPGSAQEAETVIRTATTLGLPGAVLTWTGPKPRRGLPERAREARYALLGAYARSVGVRHLVTAHTLDDQAETLLMRAAAGSGPRGLAAMRARTQQGDCTLLRPFLGLRKASLVALCRERQWPFVEDQTNSDRRYARPRWRHLIGTLEQEGITAERLARLGQRLARADDALQRTTDTVVFAASRPSAAGTLTFTATIVLSQPDEIALRLLDAALQTVCPAHRPRLNSQERLLDRLQHAFGAGSSTRFNLQGCLVSLDDETLLIAPEPRRSRGRPTQQTGSA